MDTNREFYKKALSKYGDKFKAIFAIMPDEIIEKYLAYDYITGVRKLNHDFKSMFEKLAE